MSSIATDDKIQTNLIKFRPEPHPTVTVVRTDGTNVVEYVVASQAPTTAPPNIVHTLKDAPKIGAPAMHVYYHPNGDRSGVIAAPPPPLPPMPNVVGIRNGNTHGETVTFEVKRNGTEPYRKTIRIENNENENGNGTAVGNSIPMEITQAELTAKEDSLRAQIRDGMPFGRLECGGNVMNITENIVKIGRNSKASKVSFHVGDNTYVSRKHVQIMYDRNNHDFFMLCLSKNGVFVNNEFQSKRTVATKLPQRCTFRFPSTNILVNFESFIERKEDTANDGNVVVVAPPALPPTPSSAGDVKPQTLPYQVHQGGDHSQSNQMTANQTQTFIDNNQVGNKQATTRAPLKINIPQHETDARIVVYGHQTSQPNLQRKQNSLPSPTTTISAANSCQTSPRLSGFQDSNQNLQSAFSDENFIAPLSSAVESEKPSYSYAQLIVQAISAAPDKQLTLSGIYAFISRHYPYYRSETSKGWQNSIRHNLSLNKYFMKVARTQDEPGKGCFWRIDPNSESKLIGSSYKIRKHRGNSNSRASFDMSRSAPVSPSESHLENFNGNLMHMQSAPESPDAHYHQVAHEELVVNNFTSGADMIYVRNDVLNGSGGVLKAPKRQYDGIETNGNTITLQIRTDDCDYDTAMKRKFVGTIQSQPPPHQ